jgi:hypothetical protein
MKDFRIKEILRFTTNDINLNDPLGKLGELVFSFLGGRRGKAAVPLLPSCPSPKNNRGGRACRGRNILHKCLFVNANLKESG